MTLSEARSEIRFASQNCEEIGLGTRPLSEDDLKELERQARLLLSGVSAYRAARSASGSASDG